MKKYITILVLFVFTIISCEKDDICIDAITPSLIIRFYDNDIQTEIKQVSGLTVWADGKDSIYVNQALDSIVLPLDLTKDNTLYKFSSGLTEDKINFTYTRNDVFVSRSCGYKTIFENLQIDSNTTNWLKDISINNSTIDNETAAHITIFH